PIDQRPIRVGAQKVFRQYLIAAASIRCLHRSNVVAIEIEKQVEVGFHLGIPHIVSSFATRPDSEGGNNMRNTQVKSDLDLLLDLNRDYIRSVQTSDARRCDEILAEDFLCSNPDWSLVDRQGFLRQTALPVR